MLETEVLSSILCVTDRQKPAHVYACKPLGMESIAHIYTFSQRGVGSFSHTRDQTRGFCGVSGFSGLVFSTFGVVLPVCV